MQFQQMASDGRDSDQPLAHFTAVKLVLDRRVAMIPACLDSYRNAQSMNKLLHRSSLDLEGDFHLNYQLYHDPGKETEVREYLTPDVMEKLKRFDAYDYEFAGKTVWIIAPGYHYSRSGLLDLSEAADAVANALT